MQHWIAGSKPGDDILVEETAMLTLHHLNDSRSQRILWLLEELGIPYEMKRYQRDATTRLAPPELTAVHPLGKSPVITDGDVRIAESGAIVDYIIRKHGKGAMMPAPDSADYEAYNEWLHYSEGSAMLPLMLNLYVSRLKEAGAPVHPREWILLNGSALPAGRRRAPLASAALGS